MMTNAGERELVVSVTHPVHQIVKTSPTAMDGKDPVDLPDHFAAL